MIRMTSNDEPKDGELNLECTIATAAVMMQKEEILINQYIGLPKLQNKGILVYNVRLHRFMNTRRTTKSLYIGIAKPENRDVLMLTIRLRRLYSDGKGIEKTRRWYSFGL